jgi:hypothetical protein
MRVITDPGFPWIAGIDGFVPERKWDFDRYYNPGIAEGARMDIWGIAHEPGGKAAHHLTYMRHPLERFDTLEEYGGAISFNGTIGTQTTMPLSTPKEVSEVVTRNLEIAGENGGLLCCPTHMLEPDVSWQNIQAYVEACNNFKTALT